MGQGEVSMGRFMDKPTGRYIKATQALAELVEAEGTDAAVRAYAEATWERKREGWAAKHGLQQTRGRVCLARLLGKRCGGFGRDVKGIPCQPPGADHCSLWLKEGHPEVFVSQPYGLSLKTMRELVALCDCTGLDVLVDTWPAWHFPGRVLMVEIRRGVK